jgi:hypothetical protein
MHRPRVALSIFVFTSVALMLVFSKPASTQSSVYFRADFNTNSANYNFGGRYPTGGWSVTHLSNGGWNGSGAPRLVMRAGQTQYGLGWWTPSLNRSFAMGDGVYLRFRIKYDEGMRDNENWGNKFIMMGNTGVTPNSRIIVYMQTVSESHGCSLGMRDWNTSGNPVYQWALPSYFGISSATSFLTSSLRSYSWSIAPYVNIGWDCAPPIFQTTPSNPVNGRPGPSNSAMASDGWYHVQVYAQSGNAGGGQFKVWANNNNFSSPTSQRIGFSGGLGVNGWSNGAVIGGYMDNDTPSVDLGYIIDDFEIGSAFDSAWFGGSSSGGGSSSAPVAPSGLRIVSSN